jgi:TetR/AcrR family transcriptional regulator, tetracycline repressor protein
MEQFVKDHPTMVAGIEEYFNSGHTLDDLFNDGLRLIIKDQ